MHAIAAEHATVGFNSALFDCRAIMAQSYKYKNLTTEFSHHLDVRWLPGVKGRLEQVASSLGIEEIPNHRALGDALVLAKLLDRMVLRLSSEAVAEHLDSVSDDGEAMTAGEAAGRAALTKEARSQDLEALGQLAGPEALSEYVSLKEREKQLKQELDALKPVVCAFVRDQGGKSSLDRCYITYQARPKYIFTDAVENLKAQLDDRKKLEIAQGLAHEDGQTEYVTIRWK
jgi:DNA polymerase III epsilon subunit-like protein